MISIFGASVTQQKNGYAKQLRKFLSDKVEIHGYGGMHLNDAGICFLEEASNNKPEYCLIDWFTTGYNICTPETEILIEAILYHFNTRNCKIIFLFLPFKDDPNKECFYLYCQSILDKRSIAYIDILKQIEISGIENFLRDSVHTTDFGSLLYAKLIGENFIKLKNGLTTNTNHKKTKYNNVCSLKVMKEFSKQLLLIGNCEIIGLLLTIGPHSGKLQVSGTGTNNIINTWDRWCHYPRLHFTLATLIQGNLSIQVLQDPFDTSSCKADIDFSKIPKKIIVHRIYYIGEGITIKNANEGSRIKRGKIFINQIFGRIRQKVKKLTGDRKIAAFN